MRILWPPPPLGLGTTLNLAYCSAETRVLLRHWRQIPFLGLVMPLLMLILDQTFFGGVSLQRVRELGVEPLWFRLLVVVYSGITEEVLFRLFLATVVAWFMYLALTRLNREAKAIAQWSGVLVSAAMFGLAHVGNLPDVVHPVLRAVTINGVAGLVLGWLYWWRGLEMAILTHVAAIGVLYIVLPPFL